MNEKKEKIAAVEERGRLAEAIRGAQVAAADRGDVIVDMKEADRARIEILAQDLKPVFDEVPAEELQFDFAISTGLQPRLWIDATAHVMMGRDRRTYRFVRDTRLGRVVVAESPEVKPISDAVTTYIAERIVERQRLMEGERIGLRQRPDQPASRDLTMARMPTASETRPRRSTFTDFLTVGSWFIIGALAGGGAIVLYFWDRLAPLF